MKNFIQPGDSLTVSAPYAVTSGQGVLIGALFGIAAYDAAISPGGMAAPASSPRHSRMPATAASR